MITTEQVSTLDTMESIVEKLKQAAESLDAEGVIAMCRPTEDFLAVVDGDVSSFDQFATIERDEFKKLRAHKLNYDSLHIRALGKDTFAALAMFRQVLSDVNSTDTFLKGEVTWIFNRLDGGPWRLTYLHAWHMADTDHDSK